MTVDRIPNHTSAALSRLLEQYKGKPRAEGLLACATDGLQNVEDALFSLFAGLALATATGAALDGLGRLVGFARSGLSDDQYRAVLIGVIAENYTDGTIPATETILRNLYGAASVFVDAQLLGGHIGFGVGSPTLDPAVYPIIQTVFLRALPATFQLSFLETFDNAGALAMDGPASWVRGFGDTGDDTAGGGFGDLIYQDP